MRPNKIVAPVWEATLLEIGQTLADAPHLRPAAGRALELLGRGHGVARGFVMLFEPEADELRVEASYGLDEEAARQEVTLVCVPLAVGRRAVGVLGVDLPYAEGRDYERLTKLLSVVASMLAQAVKVERLAESERARLADENAHLKQELSERYDFSHIVGSSNPMRQVYEQVTQVARTNTTVLLRGESGTGKEMVAHAIHYNSLRAGKPFIKVNCAALPETLIEAELFGYERGAFTGAQARKKGRFELADGGTLFLEEVGDLNASTQIKFLRALQEREFERLGGTETIKVNVRLIAATNKELEGAMASGEFPGRLEDRARQPQEGREAPRHHPSASSATR